MKKKKIDFSNIFEKCLALQFAARPIFSARILPAITLNNKTHIFLFSTKNKGGSGKIDKLVRIENKTHLYYAANFSLGQEIWMGLVSNRITRSKHTNNCL